MTDRRVALSVIAFLLLGAVTTVEVAWLAAGIDRIQIGSQVVRDATVGWTEHNHWGVLERRDRVSVRRRLQPCWQDRSTMGTVSDPPVWSAMHTPPTHAADAAAEAAYGWPWLALRSRQVIRAAASVDLGWLEVGIEVRPLRIELAAPPSSIIFGPPEPVHLPQRPQWLAFTGDVFIFAALWGVVLFLFLRGPRTIRRTWRRRRGRCVRCGYVLRDSVTCSECGLPSEGPMPVGRPWMILTPVAISIVLLVTLPCLAFVLRSRLSPEAEPRLLTWVRSGDVEAVRGCIEGGADVNPLDGGCSALELAAARGDIAMVDALLDLNAVPGGALTAAVVGGHSDVVRRIVERSPRFAWGVTARWDMFARDATHVVRSDNAMARLDDLGFNGAHLIQSMVLVAGTPEQVRQHLAGQIRLLLRTDAPPWNIEAALDVLAWSAVKPYDVESWVKDAAAVSRSDIVFMILDAAGRRMTIDEEAVLRHALAGARTLGHAGTVVRIMDRLAPPERRDAAVLRLVNDWSSPRGTRYVLGLLDAGVNVNTRFSPGGGSKNETTILHRAVWGAGADAAFIVDLMGRGANVDALDSRGRMPRDVAMETTDPAVRDAVLEALGE